MANYSVDRKLLEKYLPYKTEIDTWNNVCYVSLVGFMFLNTTVKGLKIPFHTEFEEVNLRFYVRYNDNQTWKRGVVFIKEIVPRPMLTLVANTLYNEHYETLQMNHSWETKGDTLLVEYQWKKDEWNTFQVTADNQSKEIKAGSEDEFITEHYWGYTQIGKNRTSEYAVEHPRWHVYGLKDHSIQVDFGHVYGPEFGLLSNEKPTSVFLAEGSEIIVREGKQL